MYKGWGLRKGIGRGELFRIFLIYALKGLSLYAVEGRKVGVIDREVNVFTCKAIFSTLTNVNFDPDRFVQLIQRCVALRDNLKRKGEGCRRESRFSGRACHLQACRPA